MIIAEKSITENLSGVGAFITKNGDPYSFLSITEGRNSRKTNKLKGMTSAPFETIERGESHKDALRRVFAETENGGQEEITVVKGQISLPDDIKRAYLCKIQINPGIWLHAYLLSALPETTFAKGKDSDTINEPRWVNIDQVDNRQRFVFRPGMLEIIQSYRSYLEDPSNFDPQTYFTVANSIPLRIYDSLDSGVSLEESLFQLVSAAE